VIEAGLAEPWHVATETLATSLTKTARVLLEQHDVLDILDVVALGQISAPPALIRPMPDVHRLLAELMVRRRH